MIKSKIYKICTIVLIFCICIVASISVAANDSRHFSQTIEKDGIKYDIDADIEKRGLFSTAKNESEEDICISVEISSDSSIEIASPPYIVYGDDFDDVKSFYQATVKNNTEGTFTCEATGVCASQIESVFVRMPAVTLVSDDTVLMEDCSDDMLTEYVDTVTNTRLAKLEFDVDDFPVIPRLATIISSVNLECVSSNIDMDLFGNMAGGYFVFVLPEGYEIPEEFDLLLEGTLERADTTYIEIPVS